MHFERDTLSSWGFVGRVQFKGAVEDREGDLSEPWLQILVAFVKWRFREVYKLEFNDEAKKKNNP